MSQSTSALREGEAVEGLRATEGQVPAEGTRTEVGVEYICERTAGQIVVDSVRLYLSNFRGIFLVYALPIFPFILLSAFATASRDESLIVGSEVLKLVVMFFTMGAVTIAISDVCLGNRPNIKRSYAALGQVFWSYVGTYLLVLLPVLASVALAVVSNVLTVLVGAALGVLVLLVSLVLLFYAIAALLFSLPVCIIERRSPIDACRRSMALGKGHYLRNLGVMFLAGLASLVVVIIAFVTGTILAAAGLHPMSMTFQLIVALAFAPIGPVYQIPAILLYYDMRVRKENFDGAALAQELMT